MPDDLLRRAKQVAAQHHTSVRALVIDALERTLTESPKSFRLRDASVGYGTTQQIDSEQINKAIDAERERPFNS